MNRRRSLALLVSLAFGITFQTGCSIVSRMFEPMNPFASRSKRKRPTGHGWHKDITATYFDITRANPPRTAWNDVDAIEENPYYFALPYNNMLKGVQNYGDCKNLWIEIVSATNGKKAFGQWEDVGPWFVNDSDYVFDNSGKVRPFAEMHLGEFWNILRQKETTNGYKPRKVLNEAGIDLSPQLAACINLQGKGKIHWRFVSESEVDSGPWKSRISRSLPHWRKRMTYLEEDISNLRNALQTTQIALNGL